MTDDKAFVDEMIEKRTAQNSELPAILEAAQQKRDADKHSVGVELDEAMRRLGFDPNEYPGWD